MSFTQELARDTAELRRQIHDMPFNRELAAGTLPMEVFRGYIIQDAHYLESFARALAICASKAPDAATIARLAGSAVKAAAGESQLHAHYMGQYGVSRAQFEAAEISAACDHYMTSLVRATSLGDFAEGLAAVLPCFWVYRDVGRDIARLAPRDNPYIAWIDTYASEEFNEGVEAMLAVTDRTGAAADEATRARMRKAFRRSCWHEWHFWDSAYHQRLWSQPVAELETA